MYMCMRLTTFSLINIFLFFNFSTSAQVADSIYNDNIKTVRFYNYGNQLSIPIINLNTNDQVELHFDDLLGNVKYYYYTYQLCDKDWSPLNLSQFDYLKGFTQIRINNYRFSSIAFTKYTHYQAILPERNSYPTRSGNYLLKVYLDGDTSKLAFTKRLLVVDNKATISARITQPFSPQYFRTHQRLEFNVNINGLNTFSAAQQIKVVVLQNNRWDNTVTNISPTFVRGNSLEYSSENNLIFAAGKEWRWIDLRDFHLQTDRVKRADYKKNSTDIFVKNDYERSTERYVYYRDINGMYTVETTQSVNPFWQSEYATVHFTFSPPDSTTYRGKNIYLFGQLTNYAFNDSTKMQFNPAKGVYETHLFLKQGYYNYTYIVADRNNLAYRRQLDGDYFEAENTYTILVYYKSFNGRSDELIGATTIDSRTDKPGFGF
ncbi:MAG TPA: DUF5103 domain-containing protein [Chitinophagaceae bacterium]|nr:DUF5103 domain-containing protein [Chitinophagaceae bacterium]